MSSEAKNFALIGAAGYVAPRHMRAIKDTGNNLLIALDPNDSVGVIDSYFPNADFFVEFERFDRGFDKLRRSGKRIDYVSICSPNYLHDAHIRFALRNGANAICEKPVVLNPWNLEALIEIESEFNSTANCILQLRLHPQIQALKAQIAAAPKDQIFDVDLSYITSRGHWYFTSWKGQDEKSGGIAANIGVHFFDMLAWVFGDVTKNDVHIHSGDVAAGYLEFERARVRWFLSINSKYLPDAAKAAGRTTHRSLTIEGKEIEFSEGFVDLHTRSYEEVFTGNGFTLKDARASIGIVSDIRKTAPKGLTGEYHPFCSLVTD
ncbi:MAG: oxidoreductase [Rhodospirillales bacterium]|jgi:UDP-N-acetyl-2-amino-2-deoxyglucuronate dehydrogenase|uniref:Gfo/Idh/MocA family protein n=1 Tax=Hwanghaeella sp. 1Z406 TaxID=3402811 RepID=UPI000C8E604C|nr:oxidoreductase [Rhodospirillales bacterium]MAO91094.1 oxidoreductase [Rhodospirillales bacterium]|tara:strand:- start:743 stop:1702 length:960 start_codon:yes stop_codon:yes gene_type:complete